MKRAMVAGVLLGGLAASGCGTSEERVSDDGNGSDRGGAAGAGSNGSGGGRGGAAGAGSNGSGGGRGGTAGAGSNGSGGGQGGAAGVGSNGSGGGRGGAAGAVDRENWGCLDDAPVPPTNALVSLQLEVIDATDRGPRTDAVVRVCSPFDVSCDSPIGNAVQVDGAGKATVQVGEDFNGFLQVYGPKGPDVDDPDFVRTIVYVPTREILRGAEGRGILVFTTALMKNLAALGGGTFEPDTSIPPSAPTTDHGLVMLTTLDCNNKPAAGISYELIGAQRTEQTSRFYTIGTAGANLPSTIPIETDAGGEGGFTNVKAGLALFRAKLNPLDRFVTRETGTSVFVRPGWYTHVFISP